MKTLSICMMACVLAGCSHFPNSASKLPSDAQEARLRSKEVEVASKASADMLAERDTLDERVTKLAPRLEPVLQLDPPTLDTLSDKIVDISVADAAVSDVLRALADQLHLNLVLDPAVAKLSDRATFVMHRTSAKTVLEDVFHTFDITGSVLGKKVYVSLMQKKSFNVGSLGARASLNVDEGGDVFGGFGKQTQNSAQLKGQTTFKEEVGSKDEGYEELSRVLQSLLSDAKASGKDGVDSGGFFTLDHLTGALFVTARPSRMRAVEEFVASSKAARRRQVQIEAQIIDVQLNDQYQLGVDWNVLTKNLAGHLGSGVATAASVTDAAGLAGRSITLPQENIGAVINGSSGGLSFRQGNFSATIDALRTFGTVRMLSNPVIRVRNGVPAYLSVGQNIRYVSRIDSSVNNLGGSSSVTSLNVDTDSLFSGIVIGVSAAINDDGKIELFVRPIQTQVQASTLALQDVGSGNKVTLPIVDMKGMTTNLALNNGDTIVIGGLIDENSTTSNNGLPGLADIPIVGHMFDNASSSRANRELILVIRARSV
ncbi:pilus (MSHA type) biogenesis protein MshL [Burkholderia seminalis]|uniref:pilus (MSHA type) biogenesis protein MshL n=1 Tax=Burkholderia seminalis TaxID=488731 RepID=UPI001452C5CB|nr:pilus (MSHA type) biogenesis protein MshL [Burkholderia seminalis]MCA8306770.1 pilus (MSHA type) biogenesis protein MshL [Burkholderia seminalis]MCA8435260.1 pilus (MSHA type) biogenesis protein MshL [Burkholderia seminalis]VWC11709.1 type II secretion system protein GspD [Burkholderia seminalis]